MVAAINETETLVLHKLELMEDLEVFLPSMPHIEYITDKDMQKDLNEVISMPEYAITKDEFAIEALLMAELLEATSSAKMIEKADSLFTQIDQLFKSNQQKILSEIRQFEQTARAVNLFFQNAGEGSNVENAYFMTVDPAYFAGSTNPKHFKELVECLDNRFYAWKLRQSPMYLGYVGDIENGAAELSKIAQKTLALAVVDVMEASTPEKVLEKTKFRKLNGSEENWGHMVVSGTWLVGRKAHTGLESEPLYIPSASAILGKMMAIHEGNSIAGFEEGALTGVQGVRFDAKKYVTSGSDTRDSAAFRQNGMVIIGWEDGQAIVLGDATAANQSDNEDLRKISRMMVSNGILKDLINHCNMKAYSKWGKQEKKEFKEQLERYLNDCIRKRKIQAYGEVQVLDINGDEVDVNVEITYFETKSQYNIRISGKKDQLQLEAKGK